MGQMEIKCKFNIGKNISILAKVTQVSDVAHGLFFLLFFVCLIAFRNNTRKVDFFQG
jgi:hypothetical protein